MKNKFLKIAISTMLLVTLTMTNFVFVGSSFISYALNELETNHENVEFDAYFKDKQNQKLDTLKLMPEEEAKLYLKVNVSKDGYFNGKVEISSTNFTLEGTDSKYVQKIEGNTVILNQLNAGTSAEIDLKIKPVKEEIMDAGLLNVSTSINLSGIYKDSTEKDIEIKSSREVKLELSEDNTVETVENDISVITNKIVKVSGEDKRVLQLSINMGLKDNNYPVKEIYSKVNVPTIDGKQPEVKKVVNLNSMLAWNYNYNGEEIETVLSNFSQENNLILWKKDGKENVIYTYIYDKDVKLEGLEITSEETVVLQNGKEIEKNIKKIVLDSEEKDNIIQVSVKNTENSIYKGKLYSGIDKQIASKTTLSVNLANIEEYIELKEEASIYTNQESKIDANVYYNKTVISKEKFDTMFGNAGIINIYNENGELLDTINNAAKVDEKGNIVIDYTGKEPKSIQIRTTTPVKEGTIDFEHTKIIRKTDREILLGATELNTNVIVKYNDYEDADVAKLVTYSKGTSSNSEVKIELKETKTEATIQLNKGTLSTIVDNEIEIKAVLVSDSEEYDLYKNPTLRIELPDEVERIENLNVDLVYETELTIKNYRVEGKTIIVELEGEQTSYKTQAISGANVVINAKVVLDRTVASKEQKINMVYTNQNAKENYNNAETIIKIVAPKDITTINSIEGLGIETIAQEEVKKVAIKRGAEKQELEAKIEIINSNAEPIEDVKILGTLLTNSKDNTLGIKITNAIELQNAKVYYTENENATNDVNDIANGWSETITEKSVKYLIVMDKIEAQSSVVATYNFEIPENLDYNLSARTGYEITYRNTLTNAVITANATTIVLETGIGPKAEVSLTGTHGGEIINSETQVVKNGEIISFNIKVSNTGSEDISDVYVSSKIPEGTTLVVPQDDYEYTVLPYYKEVNAAKFEGKIATLKVGEVKTVNFEVRVNSGVEAGKQITANTEIRYGDVIKTSNEFKAITALGNMRVSVKRGTDREEILHELGTVQYYAIVENTSNSKQENVKVKTNLSESLKVQMLTLITGLDVNEAYSSTIQDSLRLNDGEKTVVDLSEKELRTELIEYQDEINIGTLEAGEIKVLRYEILIDKTDDSKISFSVNVNNGKEEYKSNNWIDEIEKFEVSMEMTDNTVSRYLKSGDIVEYTITISNESITEIKGLTVEDTIPKQMTVRKIAINGQDVEVANENQLSVLVDIPKDGRGIIKVQAVVNYSEARNQAETIVNKAEAKIYGDTIATTSEVNHIIEANPIDETIKDNDSDSNNSDNNESSDNNVSDNNVAEGNKIISGMAWYDEDKDGRKDNTEKVFKDIKIRLLNAETKKLVEDKDGKVLEVTVDENGMYLLNNIANGKYIVMFDYDDTKYSVTKYLVDGVPESKNSNAMVNELTIGDSKEKIASTDIIVINGKNVSDINIGLVELKVFDLKVDKFVTKILIQNSSGTIVKEYIDSTLAKYEIDQKLVNGTNVIVEYKIKVTNVGELEGYAKKIVDYVPHDLKFSSELNKDWYQLGENLYSTSLANDKILPGESRALTLTLTKSMTENNIGRFNNRAEIVESYNELGIEDTNTIGNNLGSADTIITIKTGGTIVNAIIVIIAIIGLGIATFVIIKKKTKKENI